MKRPILVVTIGYILGIILGLYIKSVVPFYIFIVTSYLILKRLTTNTIIQKVNLISIKRYLRYIKIFIKPQVLLVILISSIISCSIVIYQNRNYEKLYAELSKSEDIAINAIIVGDKKESKYYDTYKVKAQYKGNRIYLYARIKKSEKIEIKYGDNIQISGIYEKPEVQRNYKGFDYSEYLKQLKICGTIKAQKIKIIEHNKGNYILTFFNKISNKMKEKIIAVLPQEQANIFNGLILGDTSQIEDDIQINFRNAGIAHILAISRNAYNIPCFGNKYIIFKAFRQKKNLYFINYGFNFIYVHNKFFTISYKSRNNGNITFIFKNNL